MIRSKVKSSSHKMTSLIKIVLFLVFLTSKLVFAASPGARKALGNPKEISINNVFPLNQSIRSLGWELGAQFFSPHSLKYLPAFSQPQIPEFLTWFPINEVMRLKNQGFLALRIDEEQLRGRLDSATLASLFQWNSELVGKLPNWTETRFLIWQKQYTRHEHLYSLNDLSRVLLNPIAVGHILNQSIYAEDCLRLEDSFSDVLPHIPVRNHGPCFSEEFPRGSVIAKLNWTSLEESAFKVYRTHPEELVAYVQNNQAQWDDLSSFIDSPGENEILTAELPSGKRFALTGIHFMVKNQADWTWLTFWWSPKGHSSFQKDQPLAFQETTPQAQHYSQCTVISDKMNAPSEREDLKQWIGAFSGGHSRRESWCSNPYIEHGAGNVGSNCIGCHQFAGTATTEATVLENSHKEIIRTNFPTDYVWSFSNGHQAWARQFLIRPSP